MHGCRLAEVLLGDSPIIRQIGDQLEKAALTEVPVLIAGESGTGKELAAKLLHNMSTHRAHNFFKVSCPAISSQFFDRELFRYEPHGPSGARADRGTLFLDEIGELDLALQGKLLYALQDFHLAGMGELSELAIDVRLICATNRDLEVEVARGNFRPDLFYRINVLRIQMPPLRQRITDVSILMNHFITVYSGQFGMYPAPLTQSFMKKLESYHWPGNIRELENMAKRYVVLGGEEHVLSVMRQSEDFRLLMPEVIDLTTPLRIQTKRAVQHLERKIILSVLEAHKWNRRKTARSLDISYRALLYKIKEGGLPSMRSSKPTLT
jgi:two-component system, NtrC family, response regulator AtoC